MAETAGKSKFHLRVLTPLRVVYDGMVDIAIARTTDGDLGVLHGHESCAALLGDGALRIIADKESKQQEVLMVLGGIITVRSDETVIVSDIADHPDKIQEYIDQLMADRAENVRREEIAELQAHRMEKAIREALVHVDVNPYAAIRKPGERDQW